MALISKKKRIIVAGTMALLEFRIPARWRPEIQPGSGILHPQFIMTDRENKTGHASGTHWEEVFVNHYRELCYFSEKIVLDAAAAEDIVQELFISLYEKGSVPQDMNFVRAYLYSATRNRCLDYLRNRQLKKNKYDLLPAVIPEDYILAAIAETEVLSIISGAIDSLPAECRKVMKLFLEGFNGAEIAEKLSLSPSTVRAQKRRGISLLKSKLPSSVMALIFGMMT